MNDYGIKISKDKIDVFKAKPYELSYSSTFDTLKVFKRGDGSVNVPFGSPQTISFDHNLGYRPAFLFFTEVSTSFGSSGQYFLAPFVFPVGGDISIVPYVNSNQLLVRYGGDQDAGGLTLNYRYIIFYNRAAPAWVK